MKKLFYPLFILLCAAGSAHSLPSSHGINKTAPFVINEANGIGLPNISTVIGTAVDIHKYINKGYTLIAEHNDLAEAMEYARILALTGEDILILSTGMGNELTSCALVRKRPTF